MTVIAMILVTLDVQLMSDLDVKQNYLLHVYCSPSQ
jgi:hypothetical protein